MAYELAPLPYDYAALEPFIDAMKPDGLFLCIPADENLQPDILKRLEKW